MKVREKKKIDEKGTGRNVAVEKMGRRQWLKEM